MNTQYAIDALTQALKFTALPYSDRTHRDNQGNVVSTSDTVKLGYVVGAAREALRSLGVDESNIPSCK